MNELLSHPAMQAAVVPFVVALVVASFWRGRFAALAVTGGFAACVAFTVGWDLEPLSSARKLELVVVAAGAVSLVLGFLPARRGRLLGVVLPALAATAACWVGWNLMKQMEVPNMLLAIAGAAVFVAALVYLSNGLPDARIAQASAAVLAWAAGALALLGASAVLSLFSLSAGSASAAVFGLQLLLRRRDLRPWDALPASVTAALVALLSCLSGGVPWYALLPLLAVPLTGRLVLKFIPQLTNGDLP
ncbi:hypothetical protein [Variovorax terrae]|uniref:Uncharacterized protein n=1 Tax=Variovorax terrae TaxID=2923278 RepID=A0A9X2AT93_9BURK|nr:hypothetical protein [Variovorax terrae]MCJ0766146.1 hypothetical protein [Variovorax terrae]